MNGEDNYENENTALQTDEEQPTKKKKRAHLPYFGTVFNTHGEKIGKVRRNVCYDKDNLNAGTLVNEDDNLYWVQDGERRGYLDSNNNLFDTNNMYVGTIRHKNMWVLAVLILLICAMAMITGVLASLYLTPSEELIPVPTLFIADKQGNAWSETENLPIFFNEKFGDTVIEPGQEGSYAFFFENRTDTALTYGLKFSCNNEYGINLMYRLKRDGAYVSGHETWESIDNLSVNNLQIQEKSKALFELEWRWEHNDEVDTFAGENSAIYKLLIELSATTI